MLIKQLLFSERFTKKYMSKVSCRLSPIQSKLTVFVLSLITSTLVSFPKAALSKTPGPPFRGSVEWSVLLCKYIGAGEPQRNLQFFQDMFFRKGSGGLADYWDNVSYGSMNFNGSTVRGWYTIPMSVEQAKKRSRDDRYNDCKNAAKNAVVNSYTPPPNHLVAVVTYPDNDLFGTPNVGAYLPESVDLTLTAHEIAHGIGLQHSFSNDPFYQNAEWSRIGEYDDQWDIMSAANVFTTPTANFGSGGPGLNAYHVDRMGWIPRNRIVTFGADGVRSREITLAALNHPEALGPQLIRIPFDPNDPFRYYTIEFRRKDGWDAGIPDDIVLIHEIKRNEDDTYISYILKSQNASKQPIQTLQLNDGPDLSGVTIKVVSISPSTNQATVSITSNIVERCLKGYVWREASPNDKVCVTPEIRTQTREENNLAQERRSPSGGDFGPETCLQGYVWREAFPGDHVCVSPESREQARDDNEQANVRRNPARFVYGPNTCEEGYVWREADLSDWVCVTPEIRTQTREENNLAQERRSPSGGDFGPETCLQGYVWREAFPGDHVCVSPESREQARDDNEQAAERLMKRL